MQRYLVTVGKVDAEVVVTPEGVIISADEPLEDWVDDPWQSLAADCVEHGWKVVDLLAPPPKEAPAPPMKITGVDPAVGGKKDPVFDFTAMDPSKLNPVGGLNVKQGKAFTLLPKKPLALPAPPIVSMPDPGPPSAWNSTAERLKRDLARVTAEMEHLRREYALAMAKEGHGIDAMNAAIYGPQNPAEARVRQFVREATLEVMRQLALDRNGDPRLLREIDERIYRASEDRMRREFEREQSTVMMAMDPRAKTFVMPEWKDIEPRMERKSKATSQRPRAVGTDGAVSDPGSVPTPTKASPRLTSPGRIMGPDSSERSPTCQ